MAWQPGYSRTSTAGHQARRRRVLARDGWLCQLRYPGCLITANTADHIVPVALGGAEDIENMQAVCQPCHAVKTQAEAQAGRAAKRQALRLPVEAHPNARVGG
jgi:5-methylcytosine-specific restriction endonuclease McrA